MTPAPAPELSVVLAAPQRASGTGAARDALAAVARSCEGLETEVIIVGTPPANPDPAIAVAAPPDLLIPNLWGIGLARARGRAVAFTSDEFRVSPGWARALLDALDAGAAGAAGPITLPGGSGAAQRAMWLLRYARFARANETLRTPVPDIPGDNAAYDRSLLTRHAADFTDEFLEVVAHRHIHAEGRTLTAASAAEAAFHPGIGPGEFAAQRFRHGIRFGQYRVRSLRQARWRCVAATPLVPVLLTARAVGHARRAGVMSGLALARALPALVGFAGAWALGEGLGAAGTIQDT